MGGEVIVLGLVIVLGRGGLVAWGEEYWEGTWAGGLVAWGVGVLRGRGDSRIGVLYGRVVVLEGGVRSMGGLVVLEGVVVFGGRMGGGLVKSGGVGSIGGD